MSIQITLDLTKEQALGIKYFLGKRYGKREGLKRLIKNAAFEIVREEAKKELDQAERNLDIETS